MFNKFFNWLTTSSANSENTSLTIKGYVTALVPVLMYFIHNPNLTTLPDSVYSVVTALFAVVSAVQILVGLVRKVYFLFVPPKTQ